MKTVLVMMMGRLGARQRRNIEKRFPKHAVKFVNESPKTSTDWFRLCRKAGGPDNVIVVIPELHPAHKAFNAGYQHVTFSRKGRLNKIYNIPVYATHTV